MEKEPELINIIEGPTPDFHSSPHWMQSIHEGPMDQEVAVCELRTASGESILDRCNRAWDEGRLVKLEYPDELRMPKRIDVVALRLGEIDEGQLLRLWVSVPVDYDALEDEMDDDDGHDDGLDDDDGMQYF